MKGIRKWLIFLLGALGVILAVFGIKKLRKKHEEGIWAKERLSARKKYL